MLERILRVFKLDRTVFAEVEHDESATTQAATVVAIVAALSVIGKIIQMLFSLVGGNDLRSPRRIVIRVAIPRLASACDVANDGEEGLYMALDRVHDLIILDIQIPKMDGLQVLQALRKEKVTTPVLLLTVRATIEDKVMGLDSGADDYLTKPFAFQELVARVRALLRRRTEAEPAVLQVAACPA